RGALDARRVAGEADQALVHFREVRAKLTRRVRERVESDEDDRGRSSRSESGEHLLRRRQRNRARRSAADETKENKDWPARYARQRKWRTALVEQFDRSADSCRRREAVMRLAGGSSRGGTQPQREAEDQPVHRHSQPAHRRCSKSQGATL